jgi:hypothetical protein
MYHSGAQVKNMYRRMRRMEDVVMCS